MNKNAIDIVNQLKGLFDQLANIYGKLDPKDMEELREFHNEHYSLSHCITWGNIACSEVIENYDKKKSLMDVLIVKPKCEPEMISIGKDLQSLQKAVKGHIECIYPEADIAFVMNEEGKLLGLDGNRKLPNGDIIAGDFLICGIDNENGEFISLTEYQQEKYSNIFADIEHCTQVEVEDSIFVEVVFPLAPPQRNIDFSLVTLSAQDKETAFLISGNPTEDDIADTKIYEEFIELLDEDDLIEVSVRNLCYGDRKDISSASKEELQYLSENYDELANHGKLSLVSEVGFDFYVHKDMEVEHG